MIEKTGADVDVSVEPRRNESSDIEDIFSLPAKIRNTTEWRELLILAEGIAALVIHTDGFADNCWVR